MSTDYVKMTNPEIVAAVTRLEDAERSAALASLGPDRQAAIEQILDSAPEVDGARAAVLEKLGREKQIVDSQTWTADGISPNSPLVTEANAAKLTPAANPEAVIDELTHAAVEKAEKAEADLAAAGKDASKPLNAPDAGRPQAVVGDKVTVGGQAGEVTAVDGAGYATAIRLADGKAVSGVEYLYADAKKAKADADWQAKK